MANVKQAIRHMGIEPINPIGSCFDSVGHQVMSHLFKSKCLPDDAYVCHGIGVSNMPGENPHQIGHAWIEGNHGSTAFETTWGIRAHAEEYRSNLCLTLIKTYSLSEFFELWKTHNHPGPFEETIKLITDRAEGAIERYRLRGDDE